MNTLILQFKKVAGLCLAVFALGCFAFSAQVQAAEQTPNTPDPGSVGGFGNTADGDSALSGATGFYNSGFGFLACLSNGASSFNTGIGAGALLLNTGLENTAVGVGTLLSNTTAGNNTGCGAFALFTNSTGTNNVAVGDNTLLFNATGVGHTAVGSGALENCIAAPTFDGNTAVGWTALTSDTTGNFNTAIGSSALFFNDVGNVNTAIGLDALEHNTGDENTATGGNAMFTNTTGIQNTATGTFALFSNTTGNLNVALGRNALNANVTGNGNTAVGSAALQGLTAGDGNVALGSGAGSGVATASNVIVIGMSETGADVSNTCFIGNIRGVTTQNADAIPVEIDSAGQLGTTSSSARFKKEIKPMDKASEALLALKPVTFHYKTDKTSTPQFGLIAEQVAEVNPNLVVRDKDGEIYTVRYDAVNAMLLNEFLKEHRKLEQLEKEVEKLTAGLQKVSAQVELNKQAPQTVLNNH